MFIIQSSVLQKQVENRRSLYITIIRVKHNLFASYFLDIRNSFRGINIF